MIKSKNNTEIANLIIRVEAVLKKKLVEIAQRERRSVSKQMAHIISEYVDKKEVLVSNGG